MTQGRSVFRLARRGATVAALLVIALTGAITYSLTAANTVPASQVGQTKYAATNIPLAVTNITSSDSDGTAGKANSGDSISVTFNQALKTSSIATPGTLTLTGAAGQTTITITGLTTAGGFTVLTNYEKSGNTSSATVNFTFTNGNQTVTATIAGAFSNAANLRTGVAKTFTFTPAATVADTNGTGATGTYTTPSALVLF